MPVHASRAVTTLALLVAACTQHPAQRPRSPLAATEPAPPSTDRAAVGSATPPGSPAAPTPPLAAAPDAREAPDVYRWTDAVPGLAPSSFAEAHTHLRAVPPGFVPVDEAIEPAARNAMGRRASWFVRGRSGCAPIEIVPAARPRVGVTSGELIGAAYLAADGAERRDRYEYELGTAGPPTMEFRSPSDERWTLVLSTSARAGVLAQNNVLAAPTSLDLELRGPSIDERERPTGRWQERILVRCAERYALVRAEPERLTLVRGATLVRAYRPERAERWYATAAQCEAASPSPVVAEAGCGSLVPADSAPRGTEARGARTRERPAHR